MSTLRIDSDNLRAHSNKVMDIVSGVRSATRASEATNLGGGAFGKMCSFMVSPLVAVKAVSDMTIEKAANTLERTAMAIRNVADQFDECDRFEAKNYELLHKYLGG